MKIDTLKLRNYGNLISIIFGSYLIAIFSAISAYFFFKSLGFSNIANSIGFIVHYLAIFVSATLLLKLAAEGGYVVFNAPKRLVFIIVPILIVSLILFVLGITLMIFLIDASLIVLAFIVAYRLVKIETR